MSRRILVAATLVSGVNALQLAADRSSDLSSEGPEGPEGPNLCMLGHFAPELFLLGVPKGGTTYFFEEFVRSSAIVNYQPKATEEDWHIKEAWVFAPSERPLTGKPYWLSHYPECDQGERKIALDATPGYFGCAITPKTIYTFYRDGLQASHVKFMVFLRNPITRAHSHFYQYVDNGVRDGAFGDVCPADVFPETFARAVGSVLATGEMCEGCLCNDVFEHSMYATSFQNYFRYFNPSQFIVVPFEMAVQQELVEFVWDMLDMPHGTGEMESLAGEDGGGETNHHEYPSLEEDLPSEIRAIFINYINSRTGADEVAKVLAHTEAHLYGYNGSMDDTSNISHWLNSTWGA